MSDIASARDHAARGRLAFAAPAIALAAVACWVIAGIVDDGLYMLSGVLGIVAFVLGAKARRDSRHAGLDGRPALAVMAVGGLLGAAFIIVSVVYGVSHVI